MSVADVQDYFSQNRAQLNLEYEEGGTPLIAAIASNRLALVQAVLELGANPNYMSKNSALPLIFAIESAISADDYGSDEEAAMSINIIKLLLQYGASPEIVDITEGETAHTYCKGKLPKAEHLLAKPA